MRAGSSTVYGTTLKPAVCSDATSMISLDAGGSPEPAGGSWRNGSKVSGSPSAMRFASGETTGVLVSPCLSASARIAFMTRSVLDSSLSGFCGARICRSAWSGSGREYGACSTRPSALVWMRNGPNSSPNQSVPSRSRCIDSMSRSAPVSTRRFVKALTIANGSLWSGSRSSKNFRTSIVPGPPRAVSTFGLIR